MSLSHGILDRNPVVRRLSLLLSYLDVRFLDFDRQVVSATGSCQPRNVHGLYATPHKVYQTCGSRCICL